MTRCRLIYRWSRASRATTGYRTKRLRRFLRATLRNAFGVFYRERQLHCEFRAFACGSNGGAPRAPLTGWSDFARCRAEPNGLHEVYFEYDDELEFIARAKDIDREITRWAGTTEVAFPVVTYTSPLVVSTAGEDQTPLPVQFDGAV